MSNIDFKIKMSSHPFLCKVLPDYEMMNKEREDPTVVTRVNYESRFYKSLCIGCGERASLKKRK